MSNLRRALTDYLELRRSLGFALRDQEQLLWQFLAYLKDTGQRQITTTGALAWATLPGGTETWHYGRLLAVRGFAKYLHGIDPSCEVPPADILRRGSHRATPFLYSGQDIAALMAATRIIRSAHRQATMRTLIGMLAVTGMRVGEAIRLEHGDIDCDAALLLVRNTKFGKTRELPVHQSTIHSEQDLARSVQQIIIHDMLLSHTVEHTLHGGRIRWLVRPFLLLFNVGLHSL